MLKYKLVPVWIFFLCYLPVATYLCFNYHSAEVNSYNVNNTTLVDAPYAATASVSFSIATSLAKMGLIVGMINHDTPYVLFKKWPFINSLIFVLFFGCVKVSTLAFAILTVRNNCEFEDSSCFHYTTPLFVLCWMWILAYGIAYGAWIIKCVRKPWTPQTDSSVV